MVLLVGLCHSPQGSDGSTTSTTTIQNQTLSLTCHAPWPALRYPLNRTKFNTFIMCMNHFAEGGKAKCGVHLRNFKEICPDRQVKQCAGCLAAVRGCIDTP